MFFISITYNNTPCIYSMIALLMVLDFIFILHPAADLYVEVIHDNIDTNLESISLQTAACVKPLFMKWILWCADFHKVLTLSQISEDNTNSRGPVQLTPDSVFTGR